MSIHCLRGGLKIYIQDSEKIAIFHENRKISMNSEVFPTSIIVRYLEWKGNHFKVGLSTLMPIFELLCPKYT